MYLKQYQVKLAYRTHNTLFILVVAILSMLLSITFLQNSTASSSLSKLTEGGSLTIRLESSPNPIQSNEQTQMKISFFKPIPWKYSHISTTT
jgi:cell division protein FtsX